jgi:hypothetical protein
MWRENEKEYCLDAGAFTISKPISDLELDEHFTDKRGGSEV